MFRSPRKLWIVWHYVVFVLNFSRISCYSTVNEDDTAGFIDGDLVLGGLFRIRKINGTNKCDQDVEVEVGIQRVEAMLYAIHEINKDENLLTNVKLGAEIRDTCSLKTKALDESLKFILDSLALHSTSQPNEQCVRNMTKNVVGVVGASRSTLSIEVAKLLRLFKVPQVSYASTSAELSDKTKYSYFARTVPPDTLQAQAMIDVVKAFQWKSVFTLNSAGSYGERGIEEFKKQAENSSVCVVLSEQVTDKFSNEQYDKIIRRFSEFSSTQVIILFLKDNHLKKLLQAARALRFVNKVWIASDEWGTRKDIVQNLGNFFNESDAITLTLPSLHLPKFEKYFKSLNGSHSRDEDPWFQQYWQQCGNATCHASFNDKLAYVIDAVYAFAYALHDMYIEKCPNKSGLCNEMKPINGTELRDRIRNVTFIGKSPSTVSFDKFGDSKGKYAVFHYTKHNQYKKVGEWQNQLNLTEVPERLHITSTCDDQCNPWSRKLVKKGTMCCVKCVDCPNKERQFVNATEAKCVDCGITQQPKSDYSGCEDLPVRHISSTWFITITLFACLGALCTSIVTALFLYNINTPLVKASERDLIFLLLVGVLFNYAMAVILVTRGNVIICAIQRFGYGFSASTCYACLLVKIDRIGRIFTTRNIKSVHFTKPQTQLVVVFLLIGVEVSLASAGLIIKPPEVIKILPTKEDIFEKCNFGRLDSMISLPYNLLLILVCTFYSFRIRKTMSMFNEAKYLGFVMYSTCIIWIAFLPVHLGTSASYQPITMSLNTTLNATTILVCLFGPKVYIIVFRPLRNAERTASITVNHFVTTNQLHQGQAGHVRKKSKDTQNAPADSSKQPPKNQTFEQITITKNNVNGDCSQPEEMKTEELSPYENSQSQDENEKIF